MMAEGAELQFLAVPAFWTRPTIREIEQYGVTVLKFPDFIRERMLPTIEKWKKRASPVQSKAKTIKLPESHWLLQMLDYMWNNKLLNSA